MLCVFNCSKVSLTAVFLVMIFMGAATSVKAIDLLSVSEPIDIDRTAETKRLHEKLITLSEYPGFAFGNQGEYFSGVNWSALDDDKINQENESDIHRSLTIDGAVSGFNVNWIFDKSNVLQKKKILLQLQKELRKAYRQGEIITFHWPMDNPRTKTDDSCSGNCNHLIDEVLEMRVFNGTGGQGDYYLVWKEWMDDFVVFLKTYANDENNIPIPIVFRPWHEMNLGENGRGKWYQLSNNSSEEYQALWKQTVRYLQQADIHQFLYAYAPSLNGAACSDCTWQQRIDRYLENYPGNEFADIMAGDCYFRGAVDQEHYKNLVNGIKVIVEASSRYQKIPALAETGYKDGMQDSPNFWKEQWLKPLYHDAYAKLPRLAYVMTWTNGNNAISHDPEFFVPYMTNSDFESFRDHDWTLFAEDLPAILGR